MYSFLAVFIKRATDYQYVAGLPRLRTGYSELFSDRTGDKGKRAYGEEDLSNVEDRVNVTKKIWWRRSTYSVTLV